MSENTAAGTQVSVVDDEIDQILAHLQDMFRMDHEYHHEEGLDFDDGDRHDLDEDSFYDWDEELSDVTDSFHMYQNHDCDDLDDLADEFFEQMLLESTDTKACVGSTRRIRLGTPRTKVKWVHD